MERARRLGPLRPPPPRRPRPAPRRLAVVRGGAASHWSAPDRRGRSNRGWTGGWTYRRGEGGTVPPLGLAEPAAIGWRWGTAVRGHVVDVVVASDEPGRLRCGREGGCTSGGGLHIWRGCTSGGLTAAGKRPAVAAPVEVGDTHRATSGCWGGEGFSDVEKRGDDVVVSLSGKASSAKECFGGAGLLFLPQIYALSSTAFVHRAGWQRGVGSTGENPEKNKPWSQSLNDKRSRSRYNDIRSAQKRRGRACKPPN